MKAERATRLFVALLIVTDLLMAGLASSLAYLLRQAIPFPDPAQGMGPFVDYLPLILIHTFSLFGVFFFARLYDLTRASRVDEFYSILAATSIVLTHLNLKAIARRPIRSPDVGVRAIVVRSLAPKGYVRVGNELWPALCETASGERGREVAVVRMEGLRLIVAPGDHPEASS